MTTTTAHTEINMSNMNNLTDFLGIANQVSDGYFWTGINILIFLVIFLTLSTGFGWEAGLLTAGFIGLLLSILLLYLELIPFWIMGFFVGIIIVMIFYIRWSDKYN